MPPVQLGIFSGIGRIRNIIDTISQLKQWIDLEKLPQAITAIGNALQNEAPVDTKEGLKSHVDLWLKALAAVAATTTTEKDDSAIRAIEHLSENLDWLLPIIADYLKKQNDSEDRNISFGSSSIHPSWNVDLTTLLQLLRMLLEILGK